MPFTLSHAAAVIPLARSPLVPSALVAGSFAPDLPYYVLLRPVWGELTHASLVGLLLVDVPMGLALLVLFRALLAEPLVAVAPGAVRTRVAHLAARPGLPPAASRGRVGALAWVVVSVLAGVVTHVLWDSWTHADGWTVLRIPALTTPVWAGVPAFKLLQWSSTVLGGAVVAGWCLRWLVRAPARPVPPRFAPPARPAAVVATVAVVAAAAAAVNVMAGMDRVAAAPRGVPVLADAPHVQLVNVAAVRGVIGAVTAAVVVLAVYGVARRWSRRSARSPGTSDENARVGRR